MWAALWSIRRLTSQDQSGQRGPIGIHHYPSYAGFVSHSLPHVVMLTNSYYQAYEMIRGITGFGAGNGPMIAIHEGFVGIAEWDGFMSGADRL